MPIGASHVSGDRTRIFSKPSSSSRLAVASVISFVLGHDELVVHEAHDIVARDAAADAAAQRHFDRVAFPDDAFRDPVERAAIEHANHETFCATSASLRVR